ncbi:YdeI/OmpD-associated family protein [Geodermatophilus sp. SYSU D01176]
MAAVTVPTDLPVLTFADRAALEEWLETEHATAPGLYVRLAKKGSGVPSVTYAELVESGLCFSWIDGRSQRLDDTSYLQRITPRRPRSVWSQKNVAAVEALTAAGRMRPAGLAAVEAARADGRWERAYAGPATATVPEDLAAALAAEPAAQRAFDDLDGRNRYARKDPPTPHRSQARGGTLQEGREGRRPY